MAQPRNTTKTSWDSIENGDIVFFPRDEDDNKFWLGPFYVSDAKQRKIRLTNGRDSMEAPEGVVVRLLKSEPISKVPEEMQGLLEPVPAREPNQEHLKDPTEFKVFTYEHYVMAVKALEGNMSETALERQAHKAVKVMWEKTEEFLKEKGKELAYIAMYGGGELRAYPVVEEEALTQ